MINKKALWQQFSCWIHWKYHELHFHRCFGIHIIFLHIFEFFILSTEKKETKIKEMKWKVMKLFGEFNCIEAYCVCALFLPIWKTLTEYWQILIRNFTAGIRNVQKVNKIPQFHSLLSHSLTLHAFLSVDGILTLRYTNIELYVILMPCISCIPFHPILKMCPFALHLSVGIYIATIFNLIYWHCNRVFTVQGSCMLSNKTKLSTYFSNRREQKKRNRNVSSVWSSGYRET